MPTRADVEPLPEPPSRPRSRRSSARRRRRLDLEAIVDSALRVLDADGLDAVTMRRVAHELGTGGASLYAYVEGKETLIAALLDRVLGEIRLGAPSDEQPWTEQVKDILRETRRVLGAHRDVARAALGNVPTGPNALGAGERLLSVLRRSPLTDQVIGYALDLLFLYVGTVAFEESLFEGCGRGAQDQADYSEQLRRYFAALPPDRFPHTAALAGPLTTHEPESDARFEFGLEVLLRGLLAMAPDPG